MVSAARRLTISGIVASMVLALAALGALPLAASASQIKYVVNNVPITNFDITRRAAFLRLQRRQANAAEQMIEQTLQVIEIRRLNIRISDRQVDEAYGRFAAGNKLSPAQMDQILGQAGVTKEHFKDFIRVQIGWNQALGARYRAEGRMSEQDAVARLLQQGGSKPTATEYLLQQVIFVVPASERKTAMPRRKREAEAMRARFNGCETTRQFAKGLIDVTVRDLGRVIAPELPPDWEKSIKEARPGTATGVRETERGYEFIGICSAREVSDDRVAQMVFQNEGALDEKAAELSKKYLAELRKKARIVER